MAEEEEKLIEKELTNRIEELEQWRKHEEGLLRKRIQTLEKKVTTYSARINELGDDITKNKRKIDDSHSRVEKNIEKINEIDEISIQAISHLADRKRAITVLIGIGLSIISILGVSSFSVFKAVDNVIESTQSAFIDRVTKAENKFETELEELEIEAKTSIATIVDEKILSRNVLNKLTDHYLNEIEPLVKDNLYLLLQARASNLSNSIDTLVRSKTDGRSRIQKPEILDDVRYLLSNVIEEYRTKLVSGRIKATERKALIYIFSGFQAIVSGNEALAAKWFTHAFSIDSNIVESKLALAFLILRGPSLPDQKTNKFELARNVLSDVYETPNFIWKNNTEWNKWQGLYSYVKAKSFTKSDRSKPPYSNLLDDARKKFKSQITLSDGTDARLNFYLGNVERVFCEIKNAGYCKQAVTQFEEAIRIDPEYISALNNYVWFQSHNVDYSIIQISNNVVKTKLENRLTDLESMPILKKNISSINTIAEGYVAIGEYDKALKVAQKIADIAFTYENKAIQAAYASRIKKICEFSTIDCDAKIRIIK